MKNRILLTILLLSFLGTSLAGNTESLTGCNETDSCLVLIQEQNKQNESEYITTCSNEYGFMYVADTYWNGANKPRIFITYVKPNSAAQRAQLRAGDEITKVNGEKVSKTTWDGFANLLDRSNSINFEVKNDYGKKDISLIKSRICIKKKTMGELYNSYWSQICNIDAENAAEELYHAEGLINKYSKGMRDMIASAHQTVVYWANKKHNFDNGYKRCTMLSSSSQPELHACLSALVNNELSIIAKEKEYEQQQERLKQQQAAYEAQQRLQQQQINALNNYSDALRNQHVQVDTNVYHRGTVNVNSNVNVNGTYNHYFW